MNKSLLSQIVVVIMWTLATNAHEVFAERRLLLLMIFYYLFVLLKLIDFSLIGWNLGIRMVMKETHFSSRCFHVLITLSTLSSALIQHFLIALMLWEWKILRTRNCSRNYSNHPNFKFRLLIVACRLLSNRQLWRLSQLTTRTERKWKCEKLAWKQKLYLKEQRLVALVNGMK